MSKKKWFEVINAAGSANGTILIYDVIGGDWFSDGTTAKDFTNALRALEAEHSNIDIRINSPGGSVWDGIAIVNAIKQSKAHIETYVDGIAYSMGAIIALAGKKTHVAKNARIMIHNASTRIAGNAAAMRTEAENLDGYDASLAMTLESKTGLSLADVKAKYFNYKDNYFSAQQALENGLVDSIIDEVAEGVDNILKMNDYNAVVAYYKAQDNTTPPVVKPANNQNQNMKKFLALAAVMACLKEGNDVTDAQITAAQAELTDADTGLVLITAEQNKKMNDASKKVTALQAQIDEVNALFGDAAKAEGFDLNASITALIEKAEKFDAADGAGRHKETKDTPPVDETAEQKWQKTFAALPHNQNAEKVLG